MKALEDFAAVLSRPLLSLLYLVLSPALWGQTVGAAATYSAYEDLPFNWKDEHGAVTRLSQWRGSTVLLTMAYSTCRQVCSYTLQRLEELQQSADRAGSPIEVIVISYDPDVDGPVSWSIYRHRHHLRRTNWHFLTGDIAATDRLASALHFPYWRYDEHLLHDFQVLLIEPDGIIAKTLTWATRNDDLFTTAADRCSSSDTQGCKQ